jgi:hypothetical protein
MQNGFQATHTEPPTGKQTEAPAPLNRKLRLVLESINDLARTTNIVSINANVSAAKMHSSEGRVFEQIAKEMRAISQRSLSEIQGLNTILAEVSELSEIINTAGRQRMLAQKMMKLICLKRISGQQTDSLDDEMAGTISLFEESHHVLTKSTLNTDSINDELSLAFAAWNEFRHSAKSEDVLATNTLNEGLIGILQRVVTEYQALAR